MRALTPDEEPWVGSRPAAKMLVYCFFTSRHATPHFPMCCTPTVNHRPASPDKAQKQGSSASRVGTDGTGAGVQTV